MGVFSSSPIESEQQAAGVRWALALCERYIEAPSKLLPAEITSSIVQNATENVERYKRELADWERQRKKGSYG